MLPDAPEGEEYRIEWGAGFSSETDEGETVDPALGYRDYSVRPEALDSNGRFTTRIFAGDSDTYPAGKSGVSLGAILFVSGELKDCEGGNKFIVFPWTPGKEWGPGMRRMLCGSHRYVPL
jgi:hypothetical protein